MMKMVIDVWISKMATDVWIFGIFPTWANAELRWIDQDIHTYF